MYQIVKDKKEIADLRDACEQIINNVQKSMLKNYFTFSFELIGIGRTNLLNL